MMEDERVDLSQCIFAFTASLPLIDRRDLTSLNTRVKPSNLGP